MRITLTLILVTALVLRITNIAFPSFTADEARIAIRGFTLANEGRDELGRKFPAVFNSLSDYQLPLTSYTTALGVKIFGKSDFGARIPFILAGTLSVWLVYLIAEIFNPSVRFRLLAALITAFSPTLIFLSRTPNETILLIFLLLTLFYFLTIKKLKSPPVISIFILLLLTSKIAWFLVVTFTVFTLLILKRDFSNKSKLIVVLSFLLTIAAVFLFLIIPQAARSLSENNFPIFSDITIKNGINKLRGQGVESGWPTLIERLFFNKLAYLFVGLFHWLSHLQPAIFFGQFDLTGKVGLVNMGAWSKILIIPTLTAIIYAIRKVNVKTILIIGYFFILTFPIIFVYPLKSPEVSALILPFMAILITTGLVVLKKYVSFLILAFMSLEVFLNFLNISSQIKNTNLLRPSWIENIVKEAYILSKNNKVALSDDIVDDITPFIAWYTIASLDKMPVTDFPYKVRLNQISGIKLIGFDNSFRSCGPTENISLILSERDLDRVKQVFDVDIGGTYVDNFNEIKASKLNSKVCIQ